MTTFERLVAIKLRAVRAVKQVSVFGVNIPLSTLVPGRLVVRSYCLLDTVVLSLIAHRSSNVNKTCPLSKYGSQMV
jgi:hypothetical protein